MGILFSPVQENINYVPISSMGVVFSLAYFVFDFLVILFVVQDADTALGRQH